jgi:hypothetical protein
LSNLGRAATPEDTRRNGRGKRRESARRDRGKTKKESSNIESNLSLRNRNSRIEEELNWKKNIRL